MFKDYDLPQSNRITIKFNGKYKVVNIVGLNIFGSTKSSVSTVIIQPQRMLEIIVYPINFTGHNLPSIYYVDFFYSKNIQRACHTLQLIGMKQPLLSSPHMGRWFIVRHFQQFGNAPTVVQAAHIDPKPHVFLRTLKVYVQLRFIIHACFFTVVILNQYIGFELSFTMNYINMDALQVLITDLFKRE